VSGVMGAALAERLHMVAWGEGEVGRYCGACLAWASSGTKPLLAL